MFRTVPLSIISSFSLYTQQWYRSYRFSDSLRAGSGRNCSSCEFNLYFTFSPKTALEDTLKIYPSCLYYVPDNCDVSTKPPSNYLSFISYKKTEYLSNGSKIETGKIIVKINLENF